MSRSPITRLAIALVALAVAAPALAQSEEELEPGTLTVVFTNKGEPLENPLFGKFYVYEPGKRERYLAWGHANRSVTVPGGSYDIVIRYTNDHIVEERVLEEYELTGDVIEEVDLEIEIAHLTIEITAGGLPVPVYSGSYSVHHAGQRGTPLASKRPGERLTIRPGLYDVEVAYRDPRGLQSTWLSGYYLEGDRFETVDIGVASARLRVTLLENGVPLAPEGTRWRVQEAESGRAIIAEGRSGDIVELAAGIYDIGLFYRTGRARSERWLRGVEVVGDDHKQIEIARAPTSLRVLVRQDERQLRAAWFSVYPAGETRAALFSGASGAEVDLEPGRYDIHAAYRNGGLRAESWLRDQFVDGRTELDVELEIRPATLRVSKPRRIRGSRPGGPYVLIVLDSSLEMRAEVGSRTRMELVQQTLDDTIGVLDDAAIELGLRVWGIAPRSQSDCGDSTLLVPLGPLDRRGLDTTLGLMRPSGYSPIAFSLQQAAQDLPAGARSTVVVITGTVDNCRGNPCDAAARLIKRGRADRIHVIALDQPRANEPRLDCIGEFHRAENRAELRSALRAIFREVASEDRGSVAVFRPGRNLWVAGGDLDETIRLSEGRYDLLIRVGGRTYTKNGVEVRGEIVTDHR